MFTPQVPQIIGRSFAQHRLTLTIACHDPRYFMFRKEAFAFSGRNLVRCVFETPMEHGKGFSSSPGEYAKGQCCCTKFPSFPSRLYPPRPFSCHRRFASLDFVEHRWIKRVMNLATRIGIMPMLADVFFLPLRNQRLFSRHIFSLVGYS